MFNALKSDFYKLFRSKSFYICAVLIVAACAFLAWFDHLIILTNLELYGTDISSLKSYGVEIGSVGVLNRLLSIPIVMIAIVAVLFITREFSFGTIRFQVSSGISRFKLYLSKLVVNLFVAVSYAIIEAISLFVSGYIVWNSFGDFDSKFFANFAEYFGLTLLLAFAVVCFYQMLAFVIKNKIGAMVICLGFPIYFGLIARYLDTVIRNIFKNVEGIKDFSLLQYVPDNYYNVFKTLDFTNKYFTTGIIVCVSYIIISTAIGIWSFSKRDAA